MIRSLWRPLARSRIKQSGSRLATQTYIAIRYISITPDERPYRQQFKAEAKRKRQEAKRVLLDGDTKPIDSYDELWELAVGIEIHAQLDTERKLFSSASADGSEEPNSNIAVCDVAYPGAQPSFQSATLLPALRAAIALGCNIQKKSSFDRKHYFYSDQPAGYQITQFYEPFARNGQLILFANDGIAPEDGESTTVGIKQIQMEQDTGKSLAQSDFETLIDFNRVSHPLIEIISMPHIHHPSTAAAYVRKVQSILKSVGAVTAGMEMGGLRADVNVSVRRRGQDVSSADQSYAGIEGLGQRTEIKNLSSFKAVEDAIIAERNRQIQILEAGGVIEGETRGWTIGGTETYKLREKEGEVDYRYMPDPDLAPLLIPGRLVEQIRADLPLLPDETVKTLVKYYGLTEKDARTIMTFDEGDRLDYFYEVVTMIVEQSPSRNTKTLGTLAGNLLIHELGASLTKNDLNWTAELLPASKMADIIVMLLDNKITTGAAKQLLAEALIDPKSSLQEISATKNLLAAKVADEDYRKVICEVIHFNENIISTITSKNVDKKLKALLGMVIGEFRKTGRQGSVDPQHLQHLLREELMQTLR